MAFTIVFFANSTSLVPLSRFVLLIWHPHLSRLCAFSSYLGVEVVHYESWASILLLLQGLLCYVVDAFTFYCTHVYEVSFLWFWVNFYKQHSIGYRNGLLDCCAPFFLHQYSHILFMFLTIWVNELVPFPFDFSMYYQSRFTHFENIHIQSLHLHCHIVYFPSMIQRSLIPRSYWLFSAFQLPPHILYTPSGCTGGRRLELRCYRCSDGRPEGSYIEVVPLCLLQDFLLEFSSSDENARF